MASVRIQIVLKDDELARLTKFCEQNHISLSGFGRSQIMGNLDYYEANPDKVRRPGDLF